MPSGLGQISVNASVTLNPLTIPASTPLRDARVHRNMPMNAGNTCVANPSPTSRIMIRLLGSLIATGATINAITGISKRRARRAVAASPRRNSG